MLLVPICHVVFFAHVGFVLVSFRVVCVVVLVSVSR